MSQDVQKLIAQSQDTTFLIGVKRRRSAVEQLGKIGTAEVVPAMVDALGDEDKEVQRNAFLGLSSITDPEAQAEIREEFMKTRMPALMQIITKNDMYPEDVAKRFSFYLKIEKPERINAEVNDQNFVEMLDKILDADLPDSLRIIEVMLETGPENIEMEIIRKFIETGRDVLFRLIDQNDWYPPDLDKKLMFLLKTKRHKKILQMLDGVDFRRIFDILADPEFPMKKHAFEALAEIDNPIIIDEICHIYITEDLPQLQDLIVDQKWSPNSYEDRIFFYFKTPFLQTFFKNRDINVDLLSGYMSISWIRKKLTKEFQKELADLLSRIVDNVMKKVPLEIEEENPLDEIYEEAREFIEQQKPDDEIKKVCNDYVKTKNQMLGNLIKKMGWAPVDVKERVSFFLRSEQLNRIYELNWRIVQPLFDISTDKNEDEQIREKALQILKQTDNSEIISQIFRLYFQTFNDQLDSIIKKNQWEPEKQTDRALYFIFSGQSEKYTTIDPEGFPTLKEAYSSMPPQQRLRLVEVLIDNKLEYFTEFLLEVFKEETSPRVIKKLCQVIKLYPDVAYKKLRALVRKVDGPALEEIIKTLDTMHTGRSLELLYYIGRVKKGLTCFWILKLLEDARWQPENPKEKVFFYELFKIRDDLVRVLQNRLVDENPEVRAKAAYSFADVRDEKYLTSLMKYVEDPDDNVGAAIAYCMGRLFALYPDKALDQFNKFHIGSIYMMFNEVRKAFMVKSEEEQINILARNFRTGSLVLKNYCISAFEVIKSHLSIPTLELALDEENQDLRLRAVRIIAEVAEPETQKTLYQLLDDNDPEIRMTAAKALAKLADDELVNRIVKRVSFNEYLHSDGLLEILSYRSPERYKEIFDRVLKRPDFEVTAKQRALVALARVGDKEAIRQIIHSFNEMIESGYNEEDLIAYTWAFGELDSPAVYKPVDKLMTLGTMRIREAMIETLPKISDRFALVMIIKALEDREGIIQKKAVYALKEYFNKQFKFHMSEKELKFIGVIISRLKKFNLHQIMDKQHEVHEISIRMTIKLLENELTRLYLKFKNKFTGSKKQ